MKKVILNVALMIIGLNVFAQKGSLTLEDEIELTTRSVVYVTEHLKTKGFSVAYSEYPAATAERTDSTVYYIYNETTGLENEIRYSKKITSLGSSTGLSFTSTEKKWYENETAKLTGMGFKLTDNTIKSETVHEAKVYEKDNITIQTFWSDYPGSDQKFYTIDVIRF